jgi:hypothetical protein
MRGLIGVVVGAIVAVAARGASPALADPGVGMERDARAAPRDDSAAPDRGADSGVVRNPAAEAALATIQARIARYVENQGTAYSFASHVDATGTIVLDTNAPASVVSSLTDLSGAPPAQRQAVSRMKLLRSTIVDTWHRRDDITPYWGGAGITNFSSICSTGYTVEDGAGTELMVTAGHCYATATVVSTESGNNQLGTVTLRRLPTVSGDPRDVELIAGSIYDDNVYTGGVTSMTSADVVAAGTAFVNYTNYCHSGRTTGEACGHTSQSITAQVCTSSGCKSPVIQFVGGVMVQGGDSGGAFYAKDTGGGVWVRGHILATNGVTGWAEPYTSVASALGVTIVT